MNMVHKRLTLLLGVSNRAYVVRAGIDLAGLTASADAPTSNPKWNILGRYSKYYPRNI